MLTRHRQPRRLINHAPHPWNMNATQFPRVRFARHTLSVFTSGQSFCGASETTGEFSCLKPQITPITSYAKLSDKYLFDISPHRWQMFSLIPAYDAENRDLMPTVRRTCPGWCCEIDSHRTHLVSWPCVIMLLMQVAKLNIWDCQLL